MKNLMIGIATFISVSFVVFLLFALGNWSFDAGKWDAPTRPLCALFCFIMGLCAAFIAVHESQKP